ncbi:hypothetical protein AB0D16_37385 [Streptomyces sp. NPDC048161]|jgi:hypothetical protein|uniref:hypothetical protein n=1 Tax=Streptomyces sp. NPDC048161 TaxID=3160985 RepID=UPI0033C4E808
MASGTAGSSGMGGIELADAVESIRNQLIDATTGGPWQIGHGDQGSTAHFGGGAPRP